MNESYTPLPNSSKINVYVPEYITTVLNDKTPDDITSTGLITRIVRVLYNVTTNTNVDKAVWYYKTNSSISDVTYYLNGTGVSGYFSRVMTNNTAVNFTTFATDNAVLPAVYNYDEPLMENYSKVNIVLPGSNDAVMTVLLNVTNTTYNFLEFMANATSTTNPLGIHLCNSSYTTGSYITSPYCTSLGDLPYTAAYNHTHTANSKHHVIPFTVVDNKFNGVLGFTNAISVILHGNTGAGDWHVKAIANVSRTDAVRTSSNTGGSWSNYAGTTDMHIHQFENTTTFFYYACSNTTLSGLTNCTALASDLIQLAGVPPTAPDVTAPVSGVLKGNVQINWTASTSPNGYPIINYTLWLVNGSDESVQIAYIVNTSATGYVWNSSAYNGDFAISVMAQDNMTQFSLAAYSQNFTLDNTAPVNVNYTPTNDTYAYLPGQLVTFDANWTDITSVVSNRVYACFPDAQPPITPICFNESVPYSRTWVITGPVYYNFTAVDEAGNENTIGTYVTYYYSDILMTDAGRTPANDTVSSSASTAFSWATTRTQAFGYPTPFQCTLHLNGSTNGTYSNSYNTTTTEAYTLNEGDTTWFVNCSHRFFNATGTNYTVVIDLTPPSIVANASNPTSPTVYGYGKMYSFNVNFTDLHGVDTVTMNFNGTATVANATFTDLSAGIYYYNWTANDSVGNAMTTGTMMYNITKLTPNLTLTVTPPQLVTNFNTTISCTTTNTDNLTVFLWVNGTQLANGSSPLTSSYIPTVAPYNFTINCTSLETVNYTTGNISYMNESKTAFSVFVRREYDNVSLRSYAVDYNGTVTPSGLAQSVVFLSLNDLPSAGSLFNLSVNGSYYNDTNWKFFDRNATGINVSAGNYTFVVNQTYLNISFKHAFTLAPITDVNISITDGVRTFTTDQGSVLIAPPTANRTFNLTPSGTYVAKTLAVNLTDLSTNLQTVYFNPVTVLLFHDERTQGFFNMSSPTSIKVQAFCNSGTNISSVVETIVNENTYNYSTPCTFDKLRFVVDYPTANYYRTLLYDNSTFSFTGQKIWLLNLYETASVTTVFQTYDLLNTYENARILVTRIINTTEDDITGDFIDIEGKITAYLMQNQQYIIKVQSDNMPERILGNYFSDASGTKVLRLFDVRINSTATSFASSVYAYSVMTNETGTLRVRSSFNDTASPRETASVTYTVRVGNTTGPVAFTTTTTSANSLITYDVPANYSNTTLAVIMDITGTDGESHRYLKLLSRDDVTVLESPAMFRSEWSFKWIIFLVITILALSLTPATAGIGATVIVAVVAFLSHIAWFSVSPVAGVSTLVLGVLFAFALMSFMKKESV